MNAVGNEHEHEPVLAKLNARWNDIVVAGKERRANRAPGGVNRRQAGIEAASNSSRLGGRSGRRKRYRCLARCGLPVGPDRFGGQRHQAEPARRPPPAAAWPRVQIGGAYCPRRMRTHVAGDLIMKGASMWMPQTNSRRNGSCRQIRGDAIEPRDVIRGVRR